MTLSLHVVDADASVRDDLSPVVYDPRGDSAYIGYSLGRGAHWRVYNFMQRADALTPEVAGHAHGYQRPDGAFEWYEYFPVPSLEEERKLEAALEGGNRADGEERLTARARRRMRPLRAGAGQAAALGQELGRALLPPRPEGGPRSVRRVAPYSEFLSPGGFASRCRWVLDDDGLSVDATIENDWWFCKSDWIEHFFRELAPKTPFVLFTGDSDRAVDRRFIRSLRRRSLVAWFASNPTFEHPKLLGLPLGLGDPSAVHGDAGDAVRAARNANPPKTRLLEVSFDVKTNPHERLACLAETRLELDPPAGTGEYLERLASTYFCVAPRGNGIDTHRMWEALYLRTVPVVTRSLLTDQHPELPLVVLDDWAQFGALELSRELYTTTWGDWDPAELSLDRYLRRVERTIDGLRRTGAAASA